MKRIFDIASSTYAVLVLSPILIIVSLLIRLESKGPIIFTQKRPGKNNRMFRIYKFRSMREGTPDLATDKIDANMYITRVGHFIRKTSIDELPQLFNIIKGDMSVVGPRPPLYNQYEFIEERTKHDVHTVRPGLTGLAQVMGRDDIPDKDKVVYDEFYIRNKSFVLDMYIILKTIKSIASSQGVKH